MKTPLVVAMVASIHLLAFGGFSLLQGCAPRTVRTGSNSSRAIVGSRPPAPAPATATAARTTPAPATATAAARTAPATRPASVPAAGNGVISLPPRSSGAAANAPAPIPAGPAPVAAVKPLTPAPLYVKPKTPSTPAATFRPAAPVDTAGLRRHRIQNGESLSVIAARNGVRTRELMELNRITDANRIRIGQEILLPAHARAPGTSAAAPAPAVKPAAPALPGGTHVVKNGDALSKIAKANGTTTAELKRLNNLTSDSIRIGQVLKLPSSAGATAARSPVETTPFTPVDPAPVQVKPDPAPAPTGGVAQSEIMELLGRDPKKPADDAIARAIAAVEAKEADIPDTPATPVETGAKPLTYKVETGDTVSRLAVVFLTSEAEIRRLNRMGPSQEVSPGQTIEIPAPKEP